MKHKKQASLKKEPAPASGVPWLSLALLAAILFGTFLMYSGSLNNAILTFDDNEYFQNYPEVTNLSWESIGMYFTNYYVIMYQPLPVLSFALNYHFTGLDPVPLHMVNIIMHLFCIILVYIFISELTSNRYISLVVSALFAFHPMNVEAVAWISARSSSMYTLFYLGALISYLRYIKTGSGKFFVYTIIWFLFSLFSKAQAVTLPVVLILFDYYYNRKLLSRKVIYEKLPLFALSIVFGIITLMDSDTQRNLTEGMLIDYSPPDMIFLVTYSFAFYLVKLVVPVNLCAVYVFPPRFDGFLPWEYYASLFFVAGVGYLVYRFRDNKQVVLCTGLFLVTIAINIQIIPSRLFIVTDRYAYFPYLGLMLLPVWLISKKREQNIIWFQKQLPFLVIFITTVIAAYATLSHKRISVWVDDIVFMTDVIDKNPPVKYIYRAYGNRGFAYKKRNDQKNALRDFNKAIELDPADARSYFNRGLVHFSLNNNQAALQDFTHAIRLDSLQPMLYSYRGQISLMLGDTAAAERDSKTCIRMDAFNYDAYNTLANINFARKEWDECEYNLSQAIKINPNFTVAVKNRGIMYLQLNRKEDACRDFLTASYQNNEDAKAFYSTYCK